jgi:hypothetical protein
LRPCRHAGTRSGTTWAARPRTNHRSEFEL